MQPHDFECFGPLGFSAFYLGAGMLPDWCKQALESSMVESPVEFLNYAKYFLLTVILESFLYLPGLRLLGSSLKRAIGILILANLCTHPAVFFIFPMAGHFFNASYIHTIAIAEIFAVVVEAAAICLAIKSLKLSFAFLVSSLANLFSWCVGLSLLAVIFGL